MDKYQTYIALSRYARWDDKQNRRETWAETVARTIDYWYQKKLLSTRVASTLFESVYNLEVMPSMRTLMTAGKALDRDNVAGYNCSYLAVDELISFDEAMYVLMCGTGVGFSVERQYISQLPIVGNVEIFPTSWFSFPNVDTEELSIYDISTNTITVMDSKIGWASAFRWLLFGLYAGNFDITWDVSQVRPAGAPLVTFGGRASGPEPLVDLFEFTKNLIRHANGRRLSSIECHDLMCKIADIVVVGGVRRSALISLSNLSDGRMQRAKQGQWWEENPQRALANNSVCYTEKPDMERFMQELLEIIRSKSGERGIFNREAAKRTAMKNGRRLPDDNFGTNPCSEIILRNKQFCNLTEVVIRPNDTLLDLQRKVTQATILGTVQSTLTDFRYLSKKWKENTEAERLLGVSLTGIMDHQVMSGSKSEETLIEWLETLKAEAISTNKLWADNLGINQSVAITCVKPSGTVSQLVNSASGIHPRYSPYYIRRVRADSKDPLTNFMKDAGIPWEPDVMKPDHTVVFDFPIKAPEESVMRKDVSAYEQLKLWKIYQDHWCEHKPSITVYVKDEDWMLIGAWVYDNFDDVSGISFLPYSDHIYKQAPYEEITEAQYNELLAKMPKHIDWQELSKFENSSNVTIAPELACSAGVCEL